MNMQVEVDKMVAARNFVHADVDYSFSALEQVALERFFTNVDKKIFYIHVLPEALIATLFSMYARLNNPRGLRGHFVDNLLPIILLSFVWDEYYAAGNVVDVGKQVAEMQKFIKSNKLTDLNSFCHFKHLHMKEFYEFLDNVQVNPHYMKQLANAPKLRAFMELYLDKYGHNSIARGAVYHIGFERISILSAKTLEWGRPGSGYIETSTRAIDMEKADMYPFEDEVSIVNPTLGRHVHRSMEVSFGEYVDHVNDKTTERSLFRHFQEKYGNITDPADLEAGIKGEVYDVLGNFLPAATTTSVGVSVSGEAFPEMLKHLMLDDTNENAAILELVMSEGEKVGADQFYRHLDISEWRRASWAYLDLKPFLKLVGLNGHFQNQLRHSKLIEWVGDPHADERLLRAFQYVEGFTDVDDFVEVIRRLKQLQRDARDKLWNQFEFANGFFPGVMSFRGWRDLHRMGLSTHLRTFLTPEIGFYLYDKPAPLRFLASCKEAHRENAAIYREMVDGGISPIGRQYPMALGNMVGFQIGHNLLQGEFVDWQRSKFTVNHEVRVVFLSGERLLRKAYPWWSEISRADMTEAYVFARTNEGIPLKEALGVS